jgi:hypothetical protein
LRDYLLVGRTLEHARLLAIEDLFHDISQVARTARQHPLG